MIDSLSGHIMTFKNDYDRLLSTLKEVSGSEMELSEYKNALETLRKQADICQNHLSIFKIDGKHNRESGHQADIENSIFQKTGSEVNLNTTITP